MKVADRTIDHDEGRAQPSSPDPFMRSRSVVTEADDYSRSVESLDIEVIRTGRGDAPTEIRSAAGEDWLATSLRIGFSVFSRTTLADDVVAVGTVVRAPPGARWVGIDLKPGDVVVYGPAAEHVAVNPEGMQFAFAVISTDDLLRAATDLELDVEVPVGEVKRMTPSAETGLVGRTLTAIAGDPAALDVPPTVSEPGVLYAMSHMLAEGKASRRVPTARRLDDRKIVLTCIDYAETVQRIPTLAELCEAAFVSERRLREAFNATHDMPPHRFFLTWGLDQARRRLLESTAETDSVSMIAATTGFTHLGRFARRYRHLFGESPSATLRRTPATDGPG